MVSDKPKTGDLLTELQLELLSALWRLGEGTVVDLHEALRRHRRVSQATVATLLGRLEKRGLLDRRREGKAHVYGSAIDPATVRHLVVREFSERTRPLFQGHLSEMVAHLLETESAEPEDLERAERLLAAAIEARRKKGA